MFLTCFKAERSRKGQHKVDLSDVKASLECHIFGKFAKSEQIMLKKERAELTANNGKCDDQKVIRQNQERIKVITAQLANSQQATADFDRQANPTSTKCMPIKDVAEARKIIELLFESAVENGANSLIHKGSADQKKETIQNLQ